MSSLDSFCHITISHSGERQGKPIKTRLKRADVGNLADAMIRLETEHSNVDAISLELYQRSEEISPSDELSINNFLSSIVLGPKYQSKVEYLPVDLPTFGWLYRGTGSVHITVQLPSDGTSPHW